MSTTDTSATVNSRQETVEYKVQTRTLLGSGWKTEVAFEKGTAIRTRNRTEAISRAAEYAKLAAITHTRVVRETTVTTRTAKVVA